MSLTVYFIGFTPSCNKDSESIRILNSCPTRQNAKEVLAELTQISVQDLNKYQLNECKSCVESGDVCEKHDGPCLHEDLDGVNFPHTLYSFPMTQKQYEDAGLDLMCIEECRINRPRFWIIEVPKGTKRSVVTTELHASIC